eukprot:IDg9400t1
MRDARTACLIHRKIELGLKRKMRAPDNEMHSVNFPELCQKSAADLGRMTLRNLKREVAEVCAQRGESKRDRPTPDTKPAPSKPPEPGSLKEARDTFAALRSFSFTTMDELCHLAKHRTRWMVGLLCALADKYLRLTPPKFDPNDSISVVAASTAIKARLECDPTLLMQGVRHTVRQAKRNVSGDHAKTQSPAQFIGGVPVSRSRALAQTRGDGEELDFRASAVPSSLKTPAEVRRYACKGEEATLLCDRLIRPSILDNL